MSSSSIKKLGEKIRSFQYKGEDIPNELLNHLQNYRLSFQKDIDTVFNILSDVSRRIRKDWVVTFRVKRIESILSKLERQPNMKLNTMGDIAGCRCIVNSDTQVITPEATLDGQIYVNYMRSQHRAKKQNHFNFTPTTYNLYLL
jgi:ppGpp synthetase/RelA/SpoT-type nucleotidyltranferase